MHIIFNPFSEGKFHPLLPGDNGQTQAGQVYAGPSTLLNYLGLYLGINTEPGPKPVRIEQYRKALSENLANFPNDFYSESFQQDEVAVARTLLQWRDTLKQAGWEFTETDQMPERLRSLARIESMSQLAPGMADHWIQVKSTIQTGYHLPIEKLQITIPWEQLPPFYQDLAQLLIAQQVTVSFANEITPEVKAKTDLGKFQQFLMNTWQENPLEAINFKGDGSLILLTGNTESELAQFTSQLIKQGDNWNPLLLNSQEKEASLNDAFRQNGLPGSREQFNAALSPIPQQFLLTPQLLWDPQDPYRLLEFLTLPDNPLPSGLCRRLASLVSGKPGRGSEKWQKTIEEYLDKVAENQGQEARDDLKGKIDFWLNHSTYPEAKKIPVKVLQERFKALRQWAFSKGQNVENGAEYQVLVSMIASVTRIFNQMEDEAAIDRITLDKWLNEVYQDHWQDRQRAEKESLPVIPGPEALHANVSELLWWNFVDQNSKAYRDWWDEAEVKYLADKEVNLWDYQSRQITAEYLSHAGLMQVKNRLILTIPEKHKGEPLTPHPFYGDLKAAAKNLSAITFPVEMGNLPEIPGLSKPNTASYALHHLPASQPYWEIRNTSVLNQREAESYSSLSDLFYYPYKWVLQHQARIKQGTLYEPVDLKRLKGDLAHRVAEILFTDEEGKGVDKMPGPDAIREWLANHFEELLAREGSVLLLRGNQKTKTEFRQQLESGLIQLARVIKEGDWQVKGMEQQFTGNFDDVGANAFVDLLLEDEEGRLAILDLKWSNGKFIQDLQNQEDLQLAFYSGLISNDGKPVPAAYYNLNKAQLISRYKDIFPGNIYPEPVSLQEAQATQQLIWERMLTTYRYRLKELQKGNIEVGEECPIEELESAQYMDGESMLTIPQQKQIKKAAPFNPFKNLIEVQ